MVKTFKQIREEGAAPTCVTAGIQSDQPVVTPKKAKSYKEKNAAVAKRRRELGLV